MIPAKKRMQLKEKSRYLMVDPDSDGESGKQDEKENMEFSNILDLYEYELN